MLSARPISWDLYEEHLDEAAFLWGQWERAMNAANYTLADVNDGPEERLLAHLDGLVLGGNLVAERLLIPALFDEDAAKIFAATWALLHAEDVDHLDLVVDALRKAEKKEARAGMARAFELSHRLDLCARLLPLWSVSPPEVQAVIVNVLSAQGAPARSDPPAIADLPWQAMLETRHPELLLAALRSLRRAPDPSYARFVEKLLGSPYLAIRDAAIEAGMILGMRSAWKTCSKLVSRNALGARLPLALLALGGESVDVVTVIKKLEVESMRRDALWALGFAGTVEAADATMAWIADDELGQAAGEAFAAITGVRLAGALIEIGATDNTSPPDDDGDEAPLPTPMPEGDLPVPNAARVRAWWAQAKAKMTPGARYLYGRPATVEALQSAILTGPTWRRRGWCLEMAIRGGGDVDGGTWARKQRPLEGEPRLDVKLPAMAKL